MEKKVRGRPFQKGTVPNPSGRPKVPAELLEARKVSKQTFEEKLQAYMRMPMADLEKLMEGYKAQGVVCLDMLVGSIIVKAIMEGCVQRMNFLLNRMGVNQVFEEHDPMLRVSTESQAIEQAPFYVVEINQGGKFLRARPRELLASERVVETEANVANG